MLFDKYEDYLNYEKNFSKHTVSAYLRDVKVFEKFLAQNDCKISNEINYSFIRQWIVSLSEKRYSKTSINRKIASLKSYFNFLVNIDIIESSPLKGHKNLKSSSKIVIPFSEDEIMQVFENFNDSKISDRDKLIIEIFYSTGLRREELINIKIQDIFLKEGLIKILGKRSKERLIPILPSLSKNLKNFISNNNNSKYLFETKKLKKISVSTVYRLINKYFRLVSSKVKVSPHVLRHTFATHMLNNGADINTIKEILGHSSLSSTQIYTKIKLPKIVNDYNKSHPRELG
ncbi:MAG: tyrosine-type recombinase/integrase [Flavobacteriaceae bacterium]|jgi:integrase/recombinase XerC|tara:strand:+ start:53 stop:916 length:864 start_codon:yes stop_codon:yes gene_type:complete